MISKITFTLTIKDKITNIITFFCNIISNRYDIMT